MRTLARSLAAAAILLTFSSFPAVADAPAAGDKAPAVSLPNQDGATVSLGQFRGKWVVLYFYPKDFTSGCTIEAHNFQRDLAKFEKANAVIVGVSVDTVDSHKGFCTKEALSFTLLSDPEGAVSKAYDSLLVRDDKKFSMRNTFLIGPDGVVRKVYLKVNPQTHSEDLLADLAHLQAAK